MTQDFEGLGRYASPPCLASEIAPDYFDPLAVDPEQARDVARWRKAERQRLLGERRALSVSERERISAALASHLEPLILARIEALGRCTRSTVRRSWFLAIGRSRASPTCGLC